MARDVIPKILEKLLAEDSLGSSVVYTHIVITALKRLRQENYKFKARFGLNRITLSQKKVLKII
jgi:hypothetical protein